MTIRRILVPFSGQAAALRALRTALVVAKAHHAHVEAWHIQPDPVDVITTGSFYIAPMDCYPPDATLADMRASYERKSRSAEKAFVKTIHKMDVERRQDETPVHYATASFDVAIGHPGPILSERGRLCDLVVMCRMDGPPEYSETLSSALFSTGRPLLLVPGRKTASTLNGRTLIAWDGSKEAARAVELAMPLLEHEKVWVVAANEEDSTQAEYIKPRDVIPYLRDHDVRVEGNVRNVANEPLPENVLKAAHELDAGLIVMGAFGHSRICESVFGGMTDFMLKKADIPVLFAH